MKYKQSKKIQKIYSEFVSRFPEDRQSILRSKEDIILDAVFKNLGLETNAPYYDSQLNDDLLTRIGSSLRESVRAVGHRLTPLIEDGIELTASNELQIIAKNIAKHIMLGTPVGENGADILDSPLANERSISALFKKHDRELLAALRTEFQYLFEAISKPAIDKGRIADRNDEKQFIAFIYSFLGFYPILEPANEELLTIPQRSTDGVWTAVVYKFERIDISPPSGIIADLLTDEKDRMYAYGLTSKNDSAPPYLLFPGTTFATGQGARLADLSNFTPRSSSGESHHMGLVEAWLNAQPKKTIAVGQSQGGILSMITAARFPNKIKAAYCFNPTALSKHTLGRFLPGWNKIPEEQRPSVIIYTQHNDPIFGLEKGFLPGRKTRIFLIIPDGDEPSINASFTSVVPAIIPQWFLELVTPTIVQAYEAHIHTYAGRRNSVLIELNREREDALDSREVFSTIKLITCGLFHPIKQVGFLNHLFVKNFIGSDAIEKYSAATLLTLACGVFLSEPYLAQGALCCMTLYLFGSWIEGEVAFRLSMTV